MINPDIIESNKRHDEISHSTFLHPCIKTVDQMIDFGLQVLGYPLQTQEITRKQCEYCLMRALQVYTKYASSEIVDIIVPLKGYDKELGLNLEQYDISDIHDISFRRDTLYSMFGQDLFFGQYAMMQSYAGSGGVFPFGGFGGMNNGCWVSVHNLREHLEMINRVTGSNPQWRYSHSTKRLKIMPTPHHTEGPNDLILITCEQEQPPEELYGNEYVQRLFIAQMKMQIGQIRKKFSSVQLLGGGQIDTTIGDEGKEEWNAAMEELRSSESFGNLCLIGE